MRAYTLKEAAPILKIGVNALKRACEQGLIKADQLDDFDNKEWRITGNAIYEALQNGTAKRLKGKKGPTARDLERLYQDIQFGIHEL